MESDELAGTARGRSKNISQAIRRCEELSIVFDDGSGCRCLFLHNERACERNRLGGFERLKEQLYHQESVGQKNERENTTMAGMSLANENVASVWQDKVDYHCLKVVMRIERNRT